MSQEVFGLNLHQTRRLIPIDDGTRFALYLTKPVENPPDEVRQQMQEAVNIGFAGIKTYIEKDVASGKVTI